MKKILMTVAAAFVAVSMNAQYYVGGSIGFQNNKSYAATTETTTSGFNFAPEFGMALDDKLGVGILVDFGTNTNKTEFVGAAAGTPSTDVTTTTIDVRPYVRYQLLQWGKANIFIDGALGLGFESQKDMKSGMNLGLYASPGIAFNVSEKWSIVAHLNDMFGFTYRKGMVPDVAGAPDAPTSLRAGLSTGGFTSGNLRFGVYYNF